MIKNLRFSLFTAFLFLGALSVQAQSFKTITFTWVNSWNAGSYLDAGIFTNEEPSLNIYCDNSLSNQVYSATWNINLEINLFGYSAIPASPDGACSQGNSFTFGPVPSTMTSIDLYVQSFERDLGSCSDPMNTGDDARFEGLVTFDLTTGSHSISSGDLLYGYNVTETPIITDISQASEECATQTLFQTEMTVTYNEPAYICSLSGNYGDLVVNGQSFTMTASPQTVLLTDLTADLNPVDINGYFDGDFSAGQYNDVGMFSAPDCFSAPLPVDFSMVEVNDVGSDVQIQWATASERNNEFFTIERSSDGNTWESIGTVAGAGTSHDAHAYSIFDQSPLDGNAFYRIKQTDFDGKEDYSKTVSWTANQNKGQEFTIFPNPAKDGIHVSGPKASSIKLISPEGLEINIPLKNAESGHVLIDTENLPNGIYILKIQHETGIETQRISILH